MGGTAVNEEEEVDRRSNSEVPKAVDWCSAPRVKTHFRWVRGDVTYLTPIRGDGPQETLR